VIGQLGKVLLLAGLATTVLGLVLVLAGRLGLGRGHPRRPGAQALSTFRISEQGM
jgi:hypothetical protein